MEIPFQLGKSFTFFPGRRAQIVKSQSWRNSRRRKLVRDDDCQKSPAKNFPKHCRTTLPTSSPHFRFRPTPIVVKLEPLTWPLTCRTFSFDRTWDPAATSPTEILSLQIAAPTTSTWSWPTHSGPWSEPKLRLISTSQNIETR